MGHGTHTAAAAKLGLYFNMYHHVRERKQQNFSTPHGPGPYLTRSKPENWPPQPILLCSLSCQQHPFCTRPHVRGCKDIPPSHTHTHTSGKLAIHPG
eukprot:1161892-Pelagomonas_calceolata.AAC.3